jgi:intraflagellar transport protein 122
MRKLADNAVAQRRYADAAHAFYQLAMESLKAHAAAGGSDTSSSNSSNSNSSSREALGAFARHYDTAELYYAYHLIHTTAHQPFKTVDDATLFNAARFLLARSLSRHDALPPGIALSEALLALASLARALGAFKLARFANTRLQVGMAAAEQRAAV